AAHYGLHFGPIATAANRYSTVLFPVLNIGRNQMLNLSRKDQLLVESVRTAMDVALSQADMRNAVAKRLAVLATGHRNQGRRTARKGRPFPGICEASGRPLATEHAVLAAC